MSTIFIQYGRFSFNRLVVVILGFCLTFFALTAVASAQIDGFIEPYRKIELASDESGSISELLVAEAQHVEEGEAIARLDTRVQELQFEIANHLASTRSQLVAADEAYKKRLAISEQLEKLGANGHASQSEIIRSQMELSIAKAKLLAAQEEITVRELEKQRAQVQLNRRTIVAPFAGVVSKIHCREGEFLSPLRAEVVTLVQVDRLIASFAVPSSQVSAFEIGKVFNIELTNGRTVMGTVESIGVETDAQSMTIEIKLVIENQELDLRSGELCTLNI
jgi:RND family efflux transporter MFP subunit